MKNLRIGGVDVNEYIKEQVAIAIAEQSKKLEQPEPKWYDNIPAQGVLCWVGDYLPITKNANSLRTIIKYARNRTYCFCNV